MDDRPNLEMSEDFISEIASKYGLTKQQIASTKGAQAVYKELIGNNNEPLIDKELAEEARRAIAGIRAVRAKMEEYFFKIQRDYEQLEEKIRSVSSVVDAIKETQDDYGAVGSDKGKDLLSLYAALMSLNQKMRIDPNESAKQVGYMMYAYLGGQAKREITYTGDHSKNPGKTIIKDSSDDYDFFDSYSPLKARRI